MPGPVKQFLDLSVNTANDTGENNTLSIQPILNGETIDQTVLQRPDESLRQRTEAIRNVETDSLYLRDADRTHIIAGPGKVTWPGSTTAAASGIPVISDTLYFLPMLTPGFAQTAPVPPVASAFGVLHLKRASDSLNSILVTSGRRSYAAGDQISVAVASGIAFSCVLDVETTYQRTIKIVATGATTLSQVITALNGLIPTAPDNTQLVTAVLEGGALGTDLLLTTQAKQYVAGNYDGEGHAITPANLASFFTTNPTQALAEGDSLCINFAMVSDTLSTGGRRQAIPENTNTAVPAGAYFNSRSHPENLVNALPICKVVNGALVFGTGVVVTAGSVAVDLGTATAADVSYTGGPAWADGTTNPATTVQAQLSKIISDLATGTGTDKLQYDGGAAWADGTTNPAATLGAQLDKIITDLAGATGTGKVQGSAVGGDLGAATLASQISSLVTGWLKLNRANTVTALQSFNGANNASFGWGVDVVPNDATGQPKPLWYALLDVGAGIALRVYSTKKSGMFITVNALVTGMSGANVTYSRDAAAWTDTTGADASRFTMDAEGVWKFQFFAASGTATWNDANWVTYASIDQNGVHWTTTTTISIPTLLSTDNVAGAPGSSHIRNSGVWTLQANTTPIYFPFEVPYNATITTYAIDLKKVDTSLAVTSHLIRSDNTGDINVSSGATSPITTGQRVLGESINHAVLQLVTQVSTPFTITQNPGQYAIKIVPGGGIVGGNDLVVGVTVTWTRPF